MKIQVNTHKDRAVKNANLHTGVCIAHQVSTSLNCDRQGVEMITTPVGIYVHHLKSGTEFIVPYSNVHILEFLKEEKAAV